MCDLSVTTNKQEGNTEWVSLPHRSFLHLHMCHKSGQRITSNPRTGIPLFGTGVRRILPIFAHWQRPRSWGVCFLCHTSMQIIATSDAHVARNRQTDRHWDTQIHGYTDTRIHGYTDTWIHRYMDTQIQIHRQWDTVLRSQTQIVATSSRCRGRCCWICLFCLIVVVDGMGVSAGAPEPHHPLQQPSPKSLPPFISPYFAVTFCRRYGVRNCKFFVRCDYPSIRILCPLPHLAKKKTVRTICYSVLFINLVCVSTSSTHFKHLLA